jgi:EpsI family protein
MNLKGPLALRLALAAVIVFATYGAMFGLKFVIQPPEVVFPAWCHKNNDVNNPELSINLPLQLGGWSGVKTDLDPVIFNATEAKIAENRIYTDDSGHTFSLHIAFYDNVDAGVWHCPTNCYRCSGWQCTSELKQRLGIEGSSSPEVLLTQWTKEDSQCLVVHWYDLGDTILYDRFGLGQARYNLRGRPNWPPLVKILIQNQNNGTSQEDKEQILSFAKQVYLWLDGVSHGKGATSGVLPVSTPEKSAKAVGAKSSVKAEKSN